MELEEISAIWREGEGRLASADPTERPRMERVTGEIVAELRRRLGGPFSQRDLAALYSEHGTDWCLAVAMRTAPESPGAWDMATVAGAAFARYAREANDYRPLRAVSRPPGMEPE